MAESFSTPVKNGKNLLEIPPSPFLKRLGYGTGDLNNIEFNKTIY